MAHVSAVFIMLLFDYSSLLFAISLSGCAMCVVLFTAWLSARGEGFLFTWSLGAAQLVIGTILFGLYASTFNYAWLSLLAFVFLITGMCCAWGAAWQFCHRRRPTVHVLRLSCLLLTPVVMAYLFGLSGTGAMLSNVAMAALLFASAAQFWRNRHEAYGPILGCVILYGMVGITFLCCALMIALESPLVMEQAPDNWAERLNAIAAIVGMTGIGATSLALHQSRLARQHRQEAETDPLTGLVNRRALFSLYDRHSLRLGTAVIIFDLDNFKQVNDAYGHAMGDQALLHFSRVLRKYCRDADTAARLGGEEFILLIPEDGEEQASLTAERIRKRFCSLPVSPDLYCTVSAGFAVVKREGIGLEQLMRAADTALYQAKRDGRNRILPAPGA